MKNVELSDTETAALIDLLKRSIVVDRHPLSPRVRTLKDILAKLRPEPVREPLPPPKDPIPATAKEHRSAAVKHEFH